jgi:hypothetical protein
MQNHFYFITEVQLVITEVLRRHNRSSYEFIQSAIGGSVHGPDSAQFTNYPN